MISLSILYIGLAICYILYRINVVKRSKLSSEIFFVLVAKILFITAMYFLFFTKPKKANAMIEIENRYFNKSSEIIHKGNHG